MQLFDFLVCVARKVTRNHHDAEDVAQEVLIDDWEQGRDQSPQRLAQRVKWRAMDLFKFRGRQKRNGEVLCDDIEATAPEDQGQIDFEKIPAELRPICEMKMAGYTNGEIAAELGINEKTVRRKLKSLTWIKRQSR